MDALWSKGTEEQFEQAFRSYWYLMSKQQDEFMMKMELK